MAIPETDIDTAAIRAVVEMQAASPVLMNRETALALCDALDAARAELAEVREERNWLSRGDLNNTMSAYRAHREVDDAVKAHLKVTIARAEAAEAERDELGATMDDIRRITVEETVRVRAHTAYTAAVTLLTSRTHTDGPLAHKWKPRALAAEAIALCRKADYEAAEAAAARWQHDYWREMARAEAAEARIAAALAVIADWDEWDREPVRRALTGGAE